MGKLSKKLAIYLDQNFISEIAKADIKSFVSRDYKLLFDLIHKGFLEEKLFVPKSFFHKIETSLVERLADRITSFQSYMGQISLHDHYDIETYQLIKAAKEFLKEASELSNWTCAYNSNPDNRLKQFDIIIKGDQSLSVFVQNNEKNAQQLIQIQKNIKEHNISYKQQFQAEIEATRKTFNKGEIAWLFKNDISKVESFVNSEYFIIPKYFINASMWAQLLTKYNDRPIKKSDLMDIDIFSTYLPYIDVMATDFFMASTIKELGLDKKYNTQVFSANQKERIEMIDYLKSFLNNNLPVNTPTISIFVLADKKIKENAWEFFKKLGLMTINDRDGWLEIFAFDDGKMPKYFDKKINMELPFCGLQEINIIKTNTTNIEKIINDCKEKCRSEKFVFIDSYRNLPDNFKKTLIDYCRCKKNKILGYNIYTK